MNPIQATPTIQGFDPVVQSVSDFQQGEIQAVQRPKSDAIKLALPINLLRRKVYAWIWADVTNASDFWAKGSIQFYKNNSRIGSMPIAVANGTSISAPGTSSIPTVCTSGGIGGTDTIGLYIANPQGSQPASVILQPLYLYGQVDEVRFNLDEVRNISTTSGLGVRCWLAVISSQ
jgi:hypothetical protein